MLGCRWCPRWSTWDTAWMRRYMPLEYNSDDDPVIADKKKIELIPALVHSTIEYEQFSKKFMRRNPPYQVFCGRLQETHDLVHVSRYLNFFTDFVSLYNTIMKQIFLGSSFSIVLYMRRQSIGNNLMIALNVAAFAVSGYASSESQLCKPFNPLLRENYEAGFSEQGGSLFL